MTHPITRRDFLKVGGGFTGLVATAGLFGQATEVADLRMIDHRPRWTKECKTICSLDSCNCGLIGYTNSEGQLTNMEGDPRNPINRGAACSKGASLMEIRNGKDFKTVNPYRIQKVLYRASGEDVWQEKDWNWALNAIANKIKATRANGWNESASRCDSIASFGGATLFNEECHLLSKALRALGLVYIDNQDRYDSATAVFANTLCTGNPASTNSWIDLENSNCILAFGASILDSCSASYYHINEALDSGKCQMITFDPRFTRTAAKSNLHVPFRSGSDLAVLNGLISFILEQPSLLNKEYLAEKTNAGALVNPNFKDTTTSGVFSGFDEINRSYDKTTWSFQTDSNGQVLLDPSLENPNCVFQIMKKHFQRYTLSNVSDTSGTDQEILAQAYQMFASTAAVGKAGAIVHSMGATQHTVGAQIIHAFNIIQLLLGNIGVAGGGIHTMRGEGNAQGNADFGLSADSLPGYLPTPTMGQDYQTYLGGSKPQAFVSLMKAWFGNAVTADNNFGFDFLPKKDPARNYSSISIFEAMAANQIKGAFCWGQNIAVSSPYLSYAIAGLSRLDWLVVADKWENETAAFWKHPQLNPSSVKTEVFLLPTVASFEKEGSTTNSSRLIQWSHQVLPGPGETKTEFEIINSLINSVKSVYGNDLPVALRNLVWNNSGSSAVLKEINGTQGSSPLTDPTQLRDDGSTACGNHLYIGVSVDQAQLNNFEKANIDMFPAGAIGNRAARSFDRDVDEEGKPAHGMYAYHGFCWPQNKHILSVNTPDGRGALFSPGFADGPLPEHYEPWESRIANPFSATNTNPVLFNLKGNQNPSGSPSTYNIVATTFRNVEHCMDGQSTRNLPWLVEMMPKAYFEISPELAEERGIQSGDLVEISSARGSMRAYAMVTNRLRRFFLQKQPLDQIAIPWQWGFMGFASGDSANNLVSAVCDRNTSTPEYKAFLVKIAKVS